MWYLYLIVASIVLYYLHHLITSLWRVGKISERCVLITGCDSGFGQMLAVKLVREYGMTVFAGCLTEDGEKELYKRVENKNSTGTRRLITFPLDVTKQESVDAARDMVTKHLGPTKGLWALVNNAGVSGSMGPFDWQSVEDWRRVMDVNCLGVVRVTEAFKPMVKRERGRIVFMTSMTGQLCAPLSGPYAASKHAAEAYADTIRLETRSFGVTVQIIEPGFMSTNITDTAIMNKQTRQLWDRQPDQIKKEYGPEYLERACQFWINSMAACRSNRVHVVPGALVHAITSRWPKRRYVLGLDANLIFSFIWLPTNWSDVIYSGILLLLRYPKPVAANRKSDRG